MFLAVTFAGLHALKNETSAVSRGMNCSHFGDLEEV